jgi:hypothetical protein
MGGKRRETPGKYAPQKLLPGSCPLGSCPTLTASASTSPSLRPALPSSAMVAHSGGRPSSSSNSRMVACSVVIRQEKWIPGDLRSRFEVREAAVHAAAAAGGRTRARRGRTTFDVRQQALARRNQRGGRGLGVVRQRRSARRGASRRARAVPCVQSALPCRRLADTRVLPGLPRGVPAASVHSKKQKSKTN